MGKVADGKEPSLVQSRVSTLSTGCMSSGSGVLSTIASTVSTVAALTVSRDSSPTKYSSSSASQVAVLESFPNCLASELVKPFLKAIALSWSMRRWLGGRFSHGNLSRLLSSDKSPSKHGYIQALLLPPTQLI